METDLRSLNKRTMGFQKEAYEGVEVYRVSVPFGKLASKMRSLCKWISKYYVKKVIDDFGKPDIIHVHLVESANDFSEMLNAQSMIPAIVTEHRCLWLDGKKYHDVRRSETKYVYRAVDRIINVSSVQADYTFKQYGCHPIVIPNYIDNQFKPSNDKHDEKFKFISVGNFEYRKRFDLTISAFSIFHQKHANSELLLVGKGGLFDDMKELVHSLGIDDSVYFCGEVNNKDMNKIYNTADAFVLPSMDESFGIVYAEAVACGLPIIATDCGGPTDIVTETNGIIVPVGDTDELVNAMEFVYKNYEQYSPNLMSNEIFSKFGKDAVISKIMALYEELVDGK